MPFGDNILEYGPDIVISSTDESTTEGNHDYDETTDLSVFAVRANILYGYNLDQPGSRYNILGAGAAMVDVEWEETSSTDTSLGTLLPGGGSSQSESGTVFTGIVNFGIGWIMQQNIDLRLEFPILIMFSEVGDAATFAPTALFSVGYQF